MRIDMEISLNRDWLDMVGVCLSSGRAWDRMDRSPGIRAHSNSSGVAFDRELKINTTTYNRQLHPVIAADSAGRFLAVWSSFLTGGNGFELFGQRLASTHPLPTMPAPFASPLSQSRVSGHLAIIGRLRRRCLRTACRWGCDTDHDDQQPTDRLELAGRKLALIPFDVSPFRRTQGRSVYGNPLRHLGRGRELRWVARRLATDLLAEFGHVSDRNEDSDGDGASNLAEFLAEYKSDSGSQRVGSFDRKTRCECLVEMEFPSRVYLPDSVFGRFTQLE